jgi:hypothetical protein
VSNVMVAAVAQRGVTALNDVATTEAATIAVSFVTVSSSPLSVKFHGEQLSTRLRSLYNCRVA